MPGARTINNAQAECESDAEISGFSDDWCRRIHQVTVRPFAILSGLVTLIRTLTIALLFFRSFCLAMKNNLDAFLGPNFSL